MRVDTDGPRIVPLALAKYMFLLSHRGLRFIVGMWFLTNVAGCGEPGTEVNRDTEFRLQVRSAVAVDRITYEIRSVTIGEVITGDLTVVEAEPPLESSVVWDWSVTLELESGDYEMWLLAWDANGELSCTGWRSFGIGPDPGGLVDTTLGCVDLPGLVMLGTPPVNQFDLLYGNRCPEDVELTSSVQSIPVGETLDLAGTASDPEGEDLSYQWFSAGGTLSNLSDGNATFLCTQTGVQSVTMSVSDGDLHCEKQRVLDVTCTEPD